MAEENKKDDQADSDKDLIAESVKGIQRCVDAEELERQLMRDDLRFATLDQWPADIRKEREGDTENGPRPCLTIDQINQYIVQVVNDMRQGKPSIKVRPVDDAADVETAKVLQGLVRNIEDQSSADIAYMTAGESAAKVGLGYFRIMTEYVGDDSKDQEIIIKPIPDTFSAYLGPHIMPDGSDSEEGYIVEQMAKGSFKDKYPKADFNHKGFETLGDDITFFRSEETITVLERFYIKKTYDDLLFLADGSTMSQEEYDAAPEPKQPIEDQRRRERRSLHWCKLTGAEILEQRALPGKYIPIIEVVGRESMVDGQRKLWGLVRPAKDSLRMYNYWASAITEKIGLAPKTPFVGAVGQFVTQAEQWRKANRVNYAKLEYDPIDVNNNALPAPRREAPAPIEVAMVQQLALIKDDVKASLGMYKAAVGESESQQSGRAILALQRESDTGTYHFGANLGVSIRHAGRVIVDMIPHYYDTKRIVRILGEDGEMQAVQLDPSQDQSHRKVRDSQGAVRSIFNPGVGKFDVTITTGPSYNTKRMEAAATFVELAKGAGDPASGAVMRYLTVKNSDSAGSDEAAKMLKALLPPPVLQAMATGQPIPPEAQAKLAQAAQELQAAQVKLHELEQENQQLHAGADVAKAKIAAGHEEAMAKMNLEHAVESERARLARERAAEELTQKRQAFVDEAALTKWKAELDARTKLEVAEIAAGATLQAAQIQAASSAAGAAQ